MFPTEFKIAFRGVNRQRYAEVFDKLNLLSKLKYPASFADDSEHEIPHFLLTSTDTGKLKSNSSPKEVQFELLAVQAYLLVQKLTGLTPEEQLQLSDEEMEIVDNYGKYEYGRLEWSKYEKKAKIEAVINFTLNATNGMLKYSGVDELVEMLNDSMHPGVFYEKSCCYFNGCFWEKSKSAYMESIDCLNQLIQFCKEKFDYDATTSHGYHASSNRWTALTGLDMLDEFTQDLATDKVTLCLDDTIEILQKLYDSQHINKIFINGLTGVDILNSIYSKVIISVYKKVCKVSDTNSGAAIMGILEKTPACFLPCLGSTKDELVLFNLFSYLDYKYLKVSDVNDKCKQLRWILSHSQTHVLSTPTLCRVLYELNSIKHKSFGLYHLYQRTHLRMMERHTYQYDLITLPGKFVTNQFCENVANLVKDIYNSTDEIVLVHESTPIMRSPEEYFEDEDVVYNGVHQPEPTTENEAIMSEPNLDVDVDADSTPEPSLENENENESDSQELDYEPPKPKKPMAKLAAKTTTPAVIPSKKPLKKLK